MQSYASASRTHLNETVDCAAVITLVGSLALPLPSFRSLASSFQHMNDRSRRPTPIEGPPDDACECDTEPRAQVLLGRSMSLPADLRSSSPPTAKRDASMPAQTCRPRLVSMWSTSTIHEDITGLKSPLHRAVARIPSVSFAVEQPDEVQKPTTPATRYRMSTPRRRLSLIVERRRFNDATTRVRTTFSIDLGLLQWCLLLTLISTASSYGIAAFRSSSTGRTVALASQPRSAVLTSSSALPAAFATQYHAPVVPRSARSAADLSFAEALRCAVGISADASAVQPWALGAGMGARLARRGLRSALPTARRSILSAMLAADHKARSLEVGSAAAIAACACAACVTGALCEAGCAVLMPDAFGAMRKWHTARQRFAHEELERVERRLSEALPIALGDANSTTVSKRVKSIRSTFEKVALRGKDLDDLLALRIVVEPRTPDEDEEAAAVERVRRVHTLVESIWPGGIVEVKDYIAQPKDNGYQSVHLLVRLPSGWRCELQIRTRGMHEHAEHGGSAHADYKAESLMVAGER